MTERPHKIQWWQTEDGQYRCHVKSGNGKVVDGDEESFIKKSYCLARAREKWPEAIVEEIDAP